MKALFSVVCVVLLAASVQGCGFLDLKCKAENEIEQAGSQLIGEAKKAFEQAMDYVFDNDIIPLLDKVESAVNATIEEIHQDVNDTINHVESAIEAIIKDAAQTANSLATNLTHDIEQIISHAASALEQAENNFYQEASSLFDKINRILQKGQCLETAFVTQMQDGIYKLLKSLNPYYRLSSCWRSLNYKITMTLEDLTAMQLYNYQKKCTILNTITPSTPVEGPGGLLQTYAQGQLYAADYYCIGETANAPTFQEEMAKEWVWWGEQYYRWRNIGITGKRSHQLPTKSDQEYRLKDDPSCGTPTECCEKAIEILKEAQQQINSIQAGLSHLNQTVIHNQAQVLANVSDNAQAITANKKAISNLRVSFCGCSINGNMNCPSGYVYQPGQFGATCCRLCID